MFCNAMKKSLFILLSVLYITSCATFSTFDKPDLGNFDTEKFINDKGGCGGQRATQIEELKTLEDKLLGLSESQINDIFGKYDYQVLSSRSQKIVIYYLEKGNHCQDVRQASDALEMVLFFNAVGLVKEVSFRTGNPVE